MFLPSAVNQGGSIDVHFLFSLHELSGLSSTGQCEALSWESDFHPDNTQLSDETTKLSQSVFPLFLTVSQLTITVSGTKCEMRVQRHNDICQNFYTSRFSKILFTQRK